MAAIACDGLYQTDNYKSLTYLDFLVDLVKPSDAYMSQ